MRNKRSFLRVLKKTQAHNTKLIVTSHTINKLRKAEISLYTCYRYIL